MHRLILPAALLLAAACSRPVAQFSYEGELEAPAEIRFNNQSEKAETYEWDFGDGATSTKPSPTHRYGASGNYLVKLKAIKGNKSKVKTERILVSPPEACLVELETEFGTMLIQLYDDTPQHRDNFLKLADEGFYDSLLFHRVIEGFMIQGGDPLSRNAGPQARLGSGGPGYTVPAEFVDSLVHVKGALAAARKGDQVNPEKASSGSQFYIVQGRAVSATDLDRFEAQKNFRYPQAQREAYLELGGTPFLDQEYTVFGRVIEGLEVVDKIAAAPRRPGDRPVEDVWMKVRVVK